MNEDSPPSRWQQLYSSSLNEIEPSSRLQSQWQEVDDKDDEEVISTWLESIPSGESSPILPFETYENKLLHSIEENEADEVINELELIIRNHDEDFIDTILDSQRHQDAISEFRMKKKARSLLHAWNRYTKLQLSQRQFAFQTVNDMKYHNMLTQSLQAWRYHWKKHREKVERLISDQKRKRMGRHFCAWANETWIQSKRIRSFRKVLMTRKVMSEWMCVPNHRKEREERANQYFQMYITRKWWDQCKEDFNISLENKLEQIKRVEEEKEKEEMERNYKVAALVHFLDKDVKLNRDNKENVQNNNHSHYSSVKFKIQNDNLSSMNGDPNRCEKQSFMVKRRILKEKHIQAKKDREKRGLDAKNRRDDEVRKAYLKRKEEEIINRKRKQHDKEIAKKAWQLAKLHYALKLLRKYFATKWTNHVRERRLLWIKAVNFWTDGIKSKCLVGIFNYTRNKRIREERNQFLNADMYHKFRICERVLHSWNNLASRSHHVLYDKTIKIRLYYAQSRVLTTWKTKLSLRRVQLIELERISTKLARRNQLSWIMRRFQAGVKETRKERKQEEIVSSKWEQVRFWLESA